jgi:hypothetical protein
MEVIIMAITTFVRKEKKYLINEEQKERLLEILPTYMDYDKYCQNNESYIVNNIYFDTDLTITENIGV